MELSLVVSELATNAVRHADGTYEVIITLDDGGVTVAVADSNPKLPERRAPDVEGGRGLTIVAALTSDWGAEPVEGDGKLVWGRLSAPGSVAG
jgi:two-component sensor histidine kinase